MVMRSIYPCNLNKRAQFFILSAVIIASIIVSLASVKNYVATGDAPKKFYYYSQQLEDETGAVVDFALYNDPTGTSTSVKNNLNNFLQYGVTKTLQAYPTMEIVACFSNPNPGKENMMICQNNGTNVVNITGIKTDNSLTNFGSLSGSRAKTITLSDVGGGTCYFDTMTYWEAGGTDENFDCITSFLDCSEVGGVNVEVMYNTWKGTCTKFLVYRQNLLASATATETVGCPTGSSCVNSEISLINLKALNVTTAAGSYQIPLVGSQVQRGQFYFIFKLNMTSGDYVDTSMGTN